MNVCVLRGCGEHQVAEAGKHQVAEAGMHQVCRSCRSCRSWQASSCRSWQASRSRTMPPMPRWQCGRWVRRPIWVSTGIPPCDWEVGAPGWCREGNGVVLVALCPRCKDFGDLGDLYQRACAEGGTWPTMGGARSLKFDRVTLFLEPYATLKTLLRPVVFPGFRVEGFGIG